MLGEMADKPPDIDIAQYRWRLPHRHRAGAERFNDKTETSEFVGARRQSRGVRLIKLNDFGDQQDLPCDA